MAAAIYALHDPSDVSARIYVGKTDDPVRRLAQHRARRRRRSLLTSWLASLRGRGVAPEMVILETVPPGGDWPEAERFWIESLRAAGASLANSKEGGIGGAAHSKATRARISATMKGRPKPAEWAANAAAGRRASGYRHPPEHMAKMAEGNRGRPLSAERVAAQVAGRRGMAVRADSETGFKGVHRTRRGDKFTATITLPTGVRSYLGTHETAPLAAAAFDAVARREFDTRQFSVNFPGDGELGAQRGGR